MTTNNPRHVLAKMKSYNKDTKNTTSIRPMKNRSSNNVSPSQLKATIMSSPDIRAGISLLIAALSAKGTSTIQNIEQIDRGYERIDERLRALGANIVRV